MNILIAVAVYPLFYNPFNVNNLGSSQPSTLPYSTNLAIFLLDSILFEIFNLENSYTVGLYKSKLLSIQ